VFTPKYSQVRLSSDCILIVICIVQLEMKLLVLSGNYDFFLYTSSIVGLK
jgi:hypothetical protein